MKNFAKKIIAACVLLSLVSAGCVEGRYYRTHHEHSPRYVERHRSSGVDVRIHN